MNNDSEVIKCYETNILGPWSKIGIHIRFARLTLFKGVEMLILLNCILFVLLIYSESSSVSKHKQHEKRAQNTP